MRFRLLIPVIITLLFIYSSCGNSNNKSVFTPNVTGSAGEVILVMEETKWEGAMGELLRDYLQQEMPALPQPEPLFDIVQIPHEAFKKLFKSHRTIIKVRINGNVDKRELIIKKNVWANPQYYFELKAKNDSDFVQLLDNVGNKMLAKLLAAEQERTVMSYKGLEANHIRKKLQDSYNINMTVPGNFRIDVNEENFAWMSHETPKLSQGILIWTYDYTGEELFSLDYLIAKRDRVLKQYVPGPKEGSYMATEKAFPTLYRVLKKDGRYTAELRGLWRVEGDFMGGPFVSITTLDSARNRLVTAEGYVYAGKQNKRNYLRQVEAIISTLEIIDE